MFKRDKHLQTDTEWYPLALKMGEETGESVGQTGASKRYWTVTWKKTITNSDIELHMLYREKLKMHFLNYGTFDRSEILIRCTVRWHGSVYQISARWLHRKWVIFYFCFSAHPRQTDRERERQRDRDGGEVNMRDLIKQTRKNKVFDYKSLIYES